MTAATVFDPVRDLAALDHEFAQSTDGSVLLFLHDPYCPLSAAAERELARLGERVALIDVAAGRDLSRAVEQRTGVRHESPQILILRDGHAVWSASHSRIRSATVAAALVAVVVQAGVISPLLRSGLSSEAKVSSVHDLTAFCRLVC